MAWVKVDDNAARHPKFLAAGAAASWLYICGLCHCQSFNTDGFISAATLPLLGVAKGYQALAGRLVAAKLWEAVANGYQVHDYLEHNRTRAAATEARAATRETKRLAGLASGRARQRAAADLAAFRILDMPSVEQPVEQTADPPPEQAVEQPVEQPVERVLNPDPTRPDPTDEQPKARVSLALAGTFPRDHLGHAWCSQRGKCVPHFLHAQFIQAVGGPVRDAESRVLGFYGRTEAGWPSGPIGDDAIVLWRRAFAAAFPSVAPAPPGPRVVPRKASTVGARVEVPSHEPL